MRYDVVPQGPGYAEDIDAPVRLEVLVFNRDNGLAQDGGEIVVIDDDAALQGKGPKRPALLIKKFSSGGGPIALQIVNLGQIDGVDKGQAGQRAGDRRQSKKDGEGDTPSQFAPMPFRLVLSSDSRRTKAAPRGFARR